MSVPSDNLKKLAEPFLPAAISWRVGSTSGDRGMALAYIDARDVMRRLDEVCGPENWQCVYPNAGNGKTCCTIHIKVGDEWIGKSNGAGDTGMEGDKGAFSDAFKRAAVLWGIGQYLYDLPAPWVETEKRGKSTVIKPAELRRLEKFLEKDGSVNKAASQQEQERPQTSSEPPAEQPEAWRDRVVAEIKAAATFDEVDTIRADERETFLAYYETHSDIACEVRDALTKRSNELK